MGGTVFIGIRRHDGTEHLFETWTNPIPRWFANPSFLDDGDAVDEFVKILEKNEAQKSIYTRRHEGVTFSEYGVILIDHCTKKILSCQGYTNPGHMSASWHRGRSSNIPADDAEIITRLNKAGRLKTLEGMRSFRILPEEEKAQLLELCAASEDGSLPGEMTVGVVIHTDLSDFEVSHTSHCGNKERQAVQEFLETNGWKARVYPDEPELEDEEQ